MPCCNPSCADGFRLRRGRRSLTRSARHSAPASRKTISLLSPSPPRQVQPQPREIYRRHRPGVMRSGSSVLIGFECHELARPVLKGLLRDRHGSRHAPNHRCSSSRMAALTNARNSVDLMPCAARSRRARIASAVIHAPSTVIYTAGTTAGGRQEGGLGEPGTGAVIFRGRGRFRVPPNAIPLVSPLSVCAECSWSDPDLALGLLWG